MYCSARSFIIARKNRMTKLNHFAVFLSLFNHREGWRSVSESETAAANDLVFCLPGKTVLGGRAVYISGLEG